MEHHTDEPTQLASMEGPPPGTVLLDKYRVDWMLGVGGYGYVLKAQHLEHGESVAIKILRDDREIDAQTLARFQREGRVVAQLKSEHVARVLDVGKLPDGQPYMVMELLEGNDLGKQLESGPLPTTLAVDYLLQACEALAEAHASGIVHRDIKPGNLFLAKLPAKRTIIKVLDFGISKSQRHYEKRLTQTQSILGTPAYMSPEQMRDAKTVDFRADIWALGAVLYELVEGRLPFDADNFAELVIAVSTMPVGPMVRAPELRPVIERCLAKRPDERFDSIAQLASALAPFGTPGHAREYVSRIHRLLGNTPPLEDLLPLLEAPVRAPTPLPIPDPALPPVVMTAPATSWTGELLPARRFPWRAVAVIGGLVGAAAIAFAVTRSDPPAQTVEPAKPAPADTKQANTAPAPAKAEPAKAEPAKAEPAKAEPAAELAKPEPAKAEPPKVESKPIVRPPKKPTTGSAATVKPPPIKPGYCPDGSKVASHWDGRCPKKS